MIMNTELNKISSWLAINKLTLNVNKCNFMVYNKVIYILAVHSILKLMVVLLSK